MKSLFAIQHTATGYFLPEPSGFAGRGGSYVEPVDCSQEFDNPRLFKSKLAATRALNAWVKGKWVKKLEYEYNDFTGGGFYYQDGVECIPVECRNKNDFDIVEFTLTKIG